MRLNMRSKREEREILLCATAIRKKQKESWDGKHSMELMRCVKIPGDGRARIRMDTLQKNRNMPL